MIYNFETYDEMIGNVESDSSINTHIRYIQEKYEDYINKEYKDIMGRLMMSEETYVEIICRVDDGDVVCDTLRDVLNQCVVNKLLTHNNRFPLNPVRISRDGIRDENGDIVAYSYRAMLKRVRDFIKSTNEFKKIVKNGDIISTDLDSLIPMIKEFRDGELSIGNLNNIKRLSSSPRTIELFVKFNMQKDVEFVQPNTPYVVIDDVAYIPQKLEDMSIIDKEFVEFSINR